jgi:hypothetical protein
MFATAVRVPLLSFYKAAFQSHRWREAAALHTFSVVLLAYSDAAGNLQIPFHGLCKSSLGKSFLGVRRRLPNIILRATGKDKTSFLLFYLSDLA